MTQPQTMPTTFKNAQRRKVVNKPKACLGTSSLPACEVEGWKSEVIRLGLRRPEPAGFPIAKNVFQLPPAAFRTFGPLFLLGTKKI